MKSAQFIRLVVALFAILALVPMAATAQDEDRTGADDTDEGFDWGWLGLLGLLGLLPRKPVDEVEVRRDTTTTGSTTTRV